jgi:hypothetical protein
MLALDIMLLALAQSSVSAPAPGALPAPRSDVEVIGPALHNRVICRVVTMSSTRIPPRQICQTSAQIEEARDRSQREAGADVNSTNRRTNEMLEQSGYGNWLRAHPGLQDRPVGVTDARQTGRGGD